MNSSGSAIVSWSFSEDDDVYVLLVGKQERGKSAEIINAFQGEEAVELFKKLTERERKGVK